MAEFQWEQTPYFHVTRNDNYSGQSNEVLLQKSRSYWQNKNLKNPLHLMQNVSGETFDAVAVRKSLSKLSDFQPVTASPYRVLHQAQGDKQK